MKIYISGPIDTEVPNADREERKARFDRCEKWILENKPQYIPVNPLKVAACVDVDAVKCELGLENINTHTWECWLRYDLLEMLKCEAIVLLPHWKTSRGAVLEADIAKRLSFIPYFADENGRIIA